MNRPILILLIALPLCAQATAARNPPDFTLHPVLFVHGSGMDSGTWQAMVRHLRDRGYPEHYLHAVDLEPSDGDNVRAARKFIAPAVLRLLEAAERLGNKTRVPRKIDIVAHSMGAVSGRWYTARLQPERVRTFIALAGANHGTDALCGYAAAGDQQMCPSFGKRDVQLALNGWPREPSDETPFGLGRDPANVVSIPPDDKRGILYLTIRIEPDAWIKPERSALLAGAGELPVDYASEEFGETSSGNLLLKNYRNHDRVPAHPAVVQLVTRVLMR